MQPIVIVPGWRNSGPGHWQSLWAEQLPHARRVEQDDWVTPRRDAWVARLSETIAAAAGEGGPVVVVAHSLGCIATVHLPFRSLVVASSNDPCCPPRLAAACARAWGSEFLRLNNAGHINIASGHGPWPLGLGLLQSLLAPLPAPPSTEAAHA